MRPVLAQARCTDPEHSPVPSGQLKRDAGIPSGSCIPIMREFGLTFVQILFCLRSFYAVDVREGRYRLQGRAIE